MNCTMLGTIETMLTVFRMFMNAPLLTPSTSDWSSARDDPDQHDYNRNRQQNVNESAHHNSGD
jgi:hypothetical protein